MSKSCSRVRVLNIGCYNPPAMDQNIVHHQISNYRVTVPVFEGPLDLLLQLIEHSELDITSVSLAIVTDQYLGYIHQMTTIAAEEISAFLVIAAKLIQIKSEALLPRPPTREIDDEDPGLSLIQQLQIYKQFKDISLWLQERENKGLRSYLRIAPPPKIEEHLDLSDITLEALILAAEEVLKKEQEKQSLDSVIKAPRITIREKIALIARYLNKENASSFYEVIEKSASRLEIVVTFLALLELIKRYRVSAFQETLFSDIQLKPLIEFNEDEEFDIEFGE
jgi:segregation and condensation protein A